MSYEDAVWSILTARGSAQIIWIDGETTCASSTLYEFCVDCYVVTGDPWEYDDDGMWHKRETPQKG